MIQPAHVSHRVQILLCGVPQAMLKSNIRYLMGAAIVLGAVIVSFAPNGMAPLLGVAALAVLLGANWRQTLINVVSRVRSAPVALLALLLFWALITVSWAVDKTAAITLWPRVMLVAIGGLILITALDNVGNVGRAALLTVTVGVCALTATILFIDRFSDAALLRGVRSITYGEVDPLIGSFFHKKSAAILAVLTWPSMAFLIQRGRYLSAVGLVALCFLGVWSSYGRTVTLAMATGLVAWPVFFLLLRPGIAAIGGLASGAVAIFPLLPRTVLAPDLLIDRFPGIGASLHHRLLIWEFVATKIAERPITGWGFNSARALPGGQDAVRPEFRNLPGWESVPLHPHNGALQIWLELGLPGGLLAAAICGAVFIAIYRSAPDRVTAATLASATCVWLVIANASYGIWQNWWQSTVWIAVAIGIALCGISRQKQRSAGNLNAA